MSGYKFVSILCKVNQFKLRKVTSKKQTNSRKKKENILIQKMAAENNKDAVCPKCTRCECASDGGNRVPITLRDLFWQDPFFSTNWDEFHKMHDNMMEETKSLWSKFDDEFKRLEGKKQVA